MDFNKDLVAGKLRRWEKYLNNYKLPMWEEIPNIGLYMEQVIVLLKDYLDYLPPELKEEQFITAAAINNYVRKKIMPEPVKKKYYRPHIAFLIIICSMKHSLPIPTLQTMLPYDTPDDELEAYYDSYAKRHRLMCDYFVEQIRTLASPILDHEEVSEVAAQQTKDLLTSCAIISGFSRLLAEKLLLLEGKTLEDGGSIEVRAKKK